MGKCGKIWLSLRGGRPFLVMVALPAGVRAISASAGARERLAAGWTSADCSLGIGRPRPRGEGGRIREVAREFPLAARRAAPQPFTAECRAAVEAGYSAPRVGLAHRRRPRDLRRRFFPGATSSSPNRRRAFSCAASPQAREQYRKACWPSGSSHTRQLARSEEAVRDRHGQAPSLSLASSIAKAVVSVSGAMLSAYSSDLQSIKHSLKDTPSHNLLPLLTTGRRCPGGGRTPSPRVKSHGCDVCWRFIEGSAISLSRHRCAAYAFVAGRSSEKRWSAFFICCTRFSGWDQIRHLSKKSPPRGRAVAGVRVRSL